MDYEYIKQKDIENEINGLDEFEKAQLYQFLTETKGIVPKNDIFVLPSRILPEVKEVIDFMKKNKQVDFKKQEEEKEKLREEFEQNAPQKTPEEEQKDYLNKKLKALISIPIVTPIYELAKELAAFTPAVTATPSTASGKQQPHSQQAPLKGSSGLLQPVMQRAAKYYKNDPVLYRLISKIKQNEKQNSGDSVYKKKQKKYTYASPVASRSSNDAEADSGSSNIPEEPELGGTEDPEEGFEDADVDQDDETEGGDADPVEDNEENSDNDDLEEPDDELDDADAENEEESTSGELKELKQQTVSKVPTLPTLPPKVRTLVDYLHTPASRRHHEIVTYEEEYS